MFTKLTLGHFKCFKSQNLHLAPLTLLAGANATGKSSILQALALLHQTTTECEWDKSILLNGDTISLGTAKDIIDKVTGRKELYIGLCSDNFECRWTMEVSDKFVLNIPLKEILWREKNEWKEEKFEIVDDVPIRRLIPLSLFNRSQNCRDLASLLHNLNYISADRLGPAGDILSKLVYSIFQCWSKRGKNSLGFILLCRLSATKAINSSRYSAYFITTNGSLDEKIFPGNKY